MNEFENAVCECACVRAFVLSKRYKPNTVGLPSSEIKACASVPLGPQCDGTTRLKLTNVVTEKTHCAVVVAKEGPAT